MSKTPPPALKPHLLIVDDEPDMLDFLERVFRTDFQVTRANSADEALALLPTRDFLVLVTDQKMPRITGVELVERIADTYPNLVKVLVSGFTDLPEVQRAVERAGIHNYVVKPVDSEQLRAAVADAIARVRGPA